MTEDGAQALETAAEAVQGADVILTMLPDADTVIDCMNGDNGVLSGQRADDVIWLQMSTIGEEGTERCAELAREHDLQFVDSPVLGTKQPAEERKLVILASGPDGVHDRLGIDPQLVFDAVEGGPLDMPYLKLKGNAMLQRDFEPSFALKLATKDAGLVEAAAKAHGLDLPVVGAIRRRMQQAVPEHGDEDLSATFLSSAPEGAAS